jgi:phage/plasmid-like protein (TIGR03299 family)
MDERKVLYRSDTLAPLSVVGAGYKPVQPGQIVGFYEDLCDKHGFAMETMGSLKQGKVIWALAKTGLRERLRGVDAIDAYLLLYTSFDQTSATVAKFTSIRVVCNNTLTMAAADHRKQAVSIRHDSEFNAAKIKVELKVGEAWAEHIQKLEALTELKVDPEQAVKMLLSVYHGLAGHEEVKPNVERTLARLASILTAAPGAGYSTAKGTAYGLLQAVTYDVDHSTRARTDDGRLASAWMGAGEALKMKAYNYVTSLLEAA